MDTETLLTVADVAVRLRVREETVREWLRRGELHGFNFGGRTGWRVPVSEIERLLTSKAGKRPGHAPTGMAEPAHELSHGGNEEA